MYWYVIPVFDTGSFYVPGMGSPVVKASDLGTFVLQAQNPKAAPTEALLGFHQISDFVPVGWTPKSLAEAQAYFEVAVGRPPELSEVY